MSELPELTVVEIDKGKPVIKKATPGEWTREELEESVRRCNCHDELIEACEEMIKFSETAEDNCARDVDGYFDTWQSIELENAFKGIKAALDKAKNLK